MARDEETSGTMAIGTQDRGASAPTLAVEGLCKRYGAVTVVDDVSFSVDPGEFYTLLGPSGCGKTTTLRCVAGLERDQSGSIRIDGALVSHAEAGLFTPPQRRDIGMVFQSYGIWPHMSVFDNVAFPLRVGRERPPSAEVQARVRVALETVELLAYERRDATALSGGQQQRLAIARAIVRRPKLLLLDEPLSNLDAKLRETMRMQVRNLQRELGITTLYVTHDQTEAMSMSTRVAVMNEGRIVQAASPRELFRHPASRFVAAFLGAANIFDAAIAGEPSARVVAITTPFGPLDVARPPAYRAGAAASYAIRPEDVRVHPAGVARGGNMFEAVVESAMFTGSTVETSLRIGAHSIRASHGSGMTLEPGAAILVELPVESGTLICEPATA